MELDQLEAFLTVVRSGSISRAARELYRTQPAVTVKIRKLESELGQQLLERRPKGVIPTPAGEVLIRRAESIFRELGALESELGDLAAQRRGSVSLGASDTICLYLLPRVLRKFSRDYPGVELRLFTQISRGVLDLIRNDQIDVGIVTLSGEIEGVETRKLYQDRFVAVYPPGHPLEKKRRITPADLRSFPLIHLKRETVTRNWLDRMLDPHGLQSQVRMEVSTIEVVKRLVEVGLGISLLPEISIHEETKLGRLRSSKLAGMELVRPMGLAYRKKKYFSHALSRFIEVLTTHASSFR